MWHVAVQSISPCLTPETVFPSYASTDQVSWTPAALLRIEFTAATFPAALNNSKYPPFKDMTTDDGGKTYSVTPSQSGPINPDLENQIPVGGLDYAYVAYLNGQKCVPNQDGHVIVRP